jgi:ABC-2 type transport system ATP-binding protein
VSPTAVAQFENVRKVYRTGLFKTRPIEALSGVSFTIRPGEVFGLLGPNRAGKTTLIKILLSLCWASGGSIFRLGAPVGQRSTLARVGYMHENQAFPRFLTATDLLGYYGALTMMDERQVKRRSSELLERVGLADRCAEPIAQFSKGMIQRLALAQALLNEPELLVMDEPAEGLDLEGRQVLRAVMAEQRAQQRSVLVVSHVLSEVEQLCDRVAVLVRGKLAYLGPLTELMRGQDDTPRPLENALEELYGAKVS